MTKLYRNRALHAHCQTHSNIPSAPLLSLFLSRSVHSCLLCSHRGWPMGLTPGPGTPAVPSSGPKDPKRKRRSSLPSPPAIVSGGYKHKRFHQKERRENAHGKEKDKKRKEAVYIILTRTQRMERRKKEHKRGKKTMHEHLR